MRTVFVVPIVLALLLQGNLAQARYNSSPPVSIGRLTAYPDNYVRRQVKLRGTVSGYRPADKQQYKGMYYLQDNTGTVLVYRDWDKPVEDGQRVTITGKPHKDGWGRVYIEEVDMIWVKVFIGFMAVMVLIIRYARRRALYP